MQTQMLIPVVNAINNGSMSTLNSYEEVELAEKLVDLHPWSDMARFSRGGGEACAIAARIARAHTGKDVIAFVDIMVGKIGILQQI